MSRFFGRTRYRMLRIVIVVGLLVPAMPMVAMAIGPQLSLTAEPDEVTVVAGELLTEAPDEAPLDESNLAIRLQNIGMVEASAFIDVVVDTETATHVQAWFQESSNPSGWINAVTDGFGPPFNVDLDYDETTELYVLADEPGEYEIRLYAYQVFMPPGEVGLQQEGNEFDVILLDTAIVTVEVEAPCQTIAEIAEEAGIFNTLLAAAAIAGLDDALADPDFGPVTIFAPTDTAFAALEAALGEEAWAALLADPDTLRDVLLYHLLDGLFYEADVLALIADGPASVTTMLGEDIVIELTDEGVVINGVALVIDTDIETCNGVIHIINAVLVPEVEEEPEEEPDEEIVPALPATGLGPDKSVPWQQAAVVVSLALGLAYSARRRNTVSSE